MGNRVEILRRAASRVRRGWTTGVYARDVNGEPCAEGARAAVCWCAVGAIMAEAMMEGHSVTDVLALMGGAGRVIQLNDSEWSSGQDAADAMMRAVTEATNG